MIESEMGTVRSKVVLKGTGGSKECVALVDTGATMTVVDRSLAEAVGAIYTGKRRALLSSTGHKLEGEVAIIKELIVEDEVLDYERVLVVEFSEEVRRVLRDLEVEDSLILGITSIEAASYMPDTSTGRLRKIESFLF